MDPTAALDHLDLAPPGGGHSMHGGTAISEKVVQAASETDLDATLNWLEKNHEGLKDGAGGLSKALGERFLDNVGGTLEMIQNHSAQQILSSRPSQKAYGS